MLDNNGWFGLYQLLATMGFPEPTVNGAGLPRVAWPDAQVGIAVPGDPDPGRGWTVTTLTIAEVEAAGSLLAKLRTLHLDHTLRASRGGAKRKTSETEQTMLAALLEAGVPEPNRNLSVRDSDGKIRAVPDFAWETVSGAAVKVALEVDGWHWHVGLDLAQEIASAASDDPEVAKQVRRGLQEKGARDNAKRRLLQQQGWVVIIVHDTELANGAATTVAAEVAATIGRRYQELTGMPHSSLGGTP